MSIPNLPTNFKDDILAATNQKRKYNLIQNNDGTVSFEDATDYQQTGSEFGAGQINATNDAINKIYSERILTMEEAALVTEPGFFVDAMVVSELIGNMPNIKTVQIITGSQMNIDYTYDSMLPEGWRFWNTAVLSFQIVVDDAARDGYNGGFVSSSRTGQYRILNKQAVNSTAFVQLLKYR